MLSDNFGWVAPNCATAEARFSSHDNPSSWRLGLRYAACGIVAYDAQINAKASNGCAGYQIRRDSLTGMKSTPPFTSEQTVLWHGIYLAIVALALIIAPGMLRVFLPFPAELDWWNRVLGACLSSH